MGQHLRQELNVMNFEHFLNLQNSKSYFHKFAIISYCMIKIRTCVANFSSCNLELEKVFHDVFGVDDIHIGGYDTLSTIACYVQILEDTSWFLNVPMKFFFNSSFFLQISVFFYVKKNLIPTFAIVFISCTNLNFLRSLIFY